MAWNTRRGASNSAAAARPTPTYRAPPPINFSRFAGFANAAVLELFYLATIVFVYRNYPYIRRYT